ncbi:MAG: hypothetical protein A3G70_03795 [Planctomycetes bacterium RIFCSPLOWO2_12_FULL_39_13]|nr:MAG: hypothetical protein A2Y09_08855 [Planctomycetes bacterium GWA2_39_15]OHB41155.1 MAG: hypothetical protein A2Y11_05780 [Planctomycetes bacterium GWC2_39_26]OHC00228.1 MAG: hypothetical protein A3G70_03795 [Planctomycetes bacterium RIFCSPLOWO2_12_FULL_39_13]
MAETKTIRHDWRDIFHALKMALDPKKMFLGYAGLLASLIWCVVSVTFFSALKLVSTDSYTFIKLILYSAKEGIPAISKNLLSAVMPLDLGELFVFAVVGFGLLAIWSLVGGAITRIAALDYARDESVQLVDALKFARKKFWSYFWSPLVPVIGVIFFALCNVIGGLIGRIPVLGEITVALGFPLALISGLLIVFVGVIGALGLCFMFPTISAEGSDAFDAMSRAYSYVISRPKQFILYCIINTSYGLLCLALVAFVAWLMIKLSFCTVGLGMGQKFSAVQSFISQKSTIACLGFCTEHLPEAKTTTVCLDHWSLKFLAGMLIIYVTLIKLAVWSFVITYWLSAKTIIYFLLRKEIDSTDVTDVYIEEITQEEKKPEISGKENEKLPQ